MEADIKNPVYEPREDSFLLQKEVRNHARGICLDVGTGSGILAKTAAESPKVKSVVAVDINKKALDYAKKKNPDKKIRFRESDLFSGIQKTKFDTIIFNPPYLPEDKRIRDSALDGGLYGYELTQRFLEYAERFLKEDGIILLLFSSLTGKDILDEKIEKNLFTHKLLSRKRLDFEELYVYLIRKSELLRDLEKKGVKDIDFYARGKRGVVYTGDNKGEKIAVKALKKDSKAHESITREIKVLKELEQKGVRFSPKVIFHGKDYFAYKFIEGINMGEFISLYPKHSIKKIINKVMGYMRTLDKLGMTKEEMHNPHKHIIINAKDKVTPFLIDFERCKKTEKPKNVTQFCQYISSGNLSMLLEKKDIFYERDVLSRMCREYKKGDDGVFDDIIGYLEKR